MRSLAGTLVTATLLLAAPALHAAPAAHAPSATTLDAQAIYYGHIGQVELGGSAGVLLSSRTPTASIAPSVGWFPADDLEISGILGISNLEDGGASSTRWLALVEPAYHTPITATIHGFLGMGLGGAYEHDVGSALAVAPRVGAKIVLGRSSVLTPSLQYQYLSHDAMPSPTAMVKTMTGGLSVNLGYSAMW